MARCGEPVASRVGAASKVWWQWRWPDPMWADGIVVSYLTDLTDLADSKGGWSSLIRVLAGCSSMSGVPMRASVSATGAAYVCRC